jgi:hypothetical protein
MGNCGSVRKAPEEFQTDWHLLRTPDVLCQVEADEAVHSQQPAHARATTLSSAVKKGSKIPPPPPPKVPVPPPASTSTSNSGWRQVDPASFWRPNEQNPAAASQEPFQNGYALQPFTIQCRKCGQEHTLTLAARHGNKICRVGDRWSMLRILLNGWLALDPSMDKFWLYRQTNNSQSPLFLLSPEWDSINFEALCVPFFLVESWMGFHHFRSSASSPHQFD